MVETLRGEVSSCREPSDPEEVARGLTLVCEEGERKAYFGISATERHKGKESGLLTHEILKASGPSILRTGGNDLVHFANSGIVSRETEFLALQNPESRDRETVRPVHFMKSGIMSWEVEAFSLQNPESRDRDAI
jgi:hypothetical protein